MYTSIFGWLAALITFIYKLPQIYTFYKGKTSKGISIISYLIQTFGYILYAIHGIIIDDHPVFITGAVSFFLNIILVSQYTYYKKQHDNNSIVRNNTDVREQSLDDLENK